MLLSVGSVTVVTAAEAGGCIPVMDAPAADFRDLGSDGLQGLNRMHLPFAGWNSSAGVCS